MTQKSPLGGNARSFLTELTKVRKKNEVPARAQDAFGVARRFMEMLERDITDPEELKLLQVAWLKAVQKNDFRRFEKMWLRVQQVKDGDLPRDGV